jgi:hypothetical protein
VFRKLGKQMGKIAAMSEIEHRSGIKNQSNSPGLQAISPSSTFGSSDMTKSFFSSSSNK